MKQNMSQVQCGVCPLSQLLGRLRQYDHLNPQVARDQPRQHYKTPIWGAEKQQKTSGN